MTHRGPFQPLPFSDAVILWSPFVNKKGLKKIKPLITSKLNTAIVQLPDAMDSDTFHLTSTTERNSA